MIELVQLKKSFGTKEVLGGVDLHIPDGNIFGLVGINGAGKSTLLRLLAGVLRADAGKILVDGEEIFENERKKREFFFLPDDPYYSMGTTAQKLIELYRTFYEFDMEVYADFEQKFKLQRQAPIRNFSKGMKRQLFIALALACRPRYLLLDEAFDGLDPLARLEFKRGLIELNEQTGCSAVISSHSLRELEDICNGFALLDGGQIADAGDIQDALEKVHKFQFALRAGRNGRVSPSSASPSRRRGGWQSSSCAATPKRYAAGSNRSRPCSWRKFRWILRSCSCAK